MGSNKSVTIKIDPLGNPVIEANGFNGVGCADATRAIEQAFAGASGEVTRELKPEWYNAEDESNQEHEGLSW